MNAAVPVMTVDCLGQKCPRPIIELARQISGVGVGELIELLADDPAAEPDVAAWCRMRGHTLMAAEPPSFTVRRDA
jgi:tRNA 2-thiouridine synthesizing protein A